MASQSTNLNEIDLLITGRNGNAKDDAVYDDLNSNIFQHTFRANYKHLSGEYPTSIAFALWLAAKIVKTGTIPAILKIDNHPGKPINKILIYNHYQGIHHTLILLSAC